MFDNVRADSGRLTALNYRPAPWCVIESLLFANGFQAVVLYRLARWFKLRRVPVLPPFLHRLTIFLTGVDIAPGADIGPGLLVSHGVGLVVGGYARIGRDCLLMHQVTIGAPSGSRLQQMPTLGDHVAVAAGAKVIGPVTVGDHVFIGADALVTRDVPANSKVTAERSIQIATRTPAELPPAVVSADAS